MTRRRRYVVAEDSLDLLLDTITNTFGGVLFLAILVSVLLQFSEPPMRQRPSTGDLQSHLSSRLAELSALKDLTATIQKAQASQQNSIDRLKETSQDESAELARILRHRIEALESEIREARSRLQSTDESVTQLRESLGQADHAKTNALKELASAEASYREALKRHTRSTELPQSHTTDRLEYPLAIKYDRVYFIYQRLERLSTNLNEDDFVTLTMDTDKMIIKPHPRRGLMITEDDFVNAVTKDLTVAPPDSFYLCLLIWRDSFDSFAALRQSLVSLGYEYRLIVMDEDGEISLGASSPLVQ